VRRYRFGRIAAPLAIGYAAVVVAAGVGALVTGDPTLLRRLVAGDWPTLFGFTWWLEVLLVAGGLLQAWAYWQVLRGRAAGEPHRGGRAVGLLRAALYVTVAYGLIFQLPMVRVPYQWWVEIPSGLVDLAVVWLFFVVLAGVLPRWLRIVGLAAGLLSNVLGTAVTVAEQLGAAFAQNPLWLLLIRPLYLTWVILVLVGQARDPRWSRGTVRVGAAAASLSFLSPGTVGFVSYGGEVDPLTALHMLTGVLAVVWSVWQARSAHELASPPGRPSPRAVPTRVAPRPWPLVALAAVPPLIPAAVNLAQGMPMWIGPRGAVAEFFRAFVGVPDFLLWLAVDLLVGLGAPAVLVVIAAARRSGRLVRGTILALLVAAAAGVVTVATTSSEPLPEGFPELVEEQLRFYPDGLFVPDQSGRLRFGLSPLWYSAALAASAFALFLLYTKPPAVRPRLHILAGTAGVLTALCFLPAADHARGPVTTAADCAPDPWDPGGRAEGERPAGVRDFICNVRRGGTLKLPDTTPDLALLAYGRRLCDVYTRDDPRELARVRSVHGVDVRGLSWELAGICPAADAAVKARQDAWDREFEEFQAEERRKCAATPRHRPRIRPVKAIRLAEPQWPEAGLELYEPDGRADARDDLYPEDGLVTGGPGHLIVQLDSDFHVCVTLETYARRPPVEVKGWDEVVEAGYHSPTGRLVLEDALSGTELPDLSLHGRKGHYRIRVHYAWFPWKGERHGTQRLLIMAYPGPGDKLLTYRKRSRR